jgi:hypothetical protein
MSRGILAAPDRAPIRTRWLASTCDDPHNKAAEMPDLHRPGRRTPFVPQQSVGRRSAKAGAAYRLRRVAVAALGLLLLTGQAPAQEDPDWPCIQRKVPHLSVAQLWAGPPLPEAGAGAEDAELARLAAAISARRTDLDDVRPLLAGLGPGDGQSRDDRLLALFRAVFEAIDRERARVIEGIARFARRQRELAGQIDARGTAVRDAEAAAAPGDAEAAARVAEMRDELAWNVRIYQDRQRSLSFVCESPVLLEKRAFAVAQMVQAEIGRD